MYLKNKYLLRTCFQCCKKKTLEISLFCICVPKISMIWSTVSEIKSVTDNDQENKNFEKMKKTLEDIIILHMMYEIWSAMDNIFVIGRFFASWPKKSNSEKMKKKKHLKIFCTSVSKIMICAWLFLRYNLWQIIFIFNFGLFSVLLSL